MRNLKKFLALVLALMMAFSLMVTVNAANADPMSDLEDVTEELQEAVTVLNGMGIITGFENGEFRPQDPIRRVDVSALVYRLVTGDWQDSRSNLYSTYQKFSDVTSTYSWAAGYIGYCANQEIIKGVGGNRYAPESNVTGYQILAMVLRAVGYDQNGEFEGTDWQVRVASTATQLGILNNINTTSYAGTLGDPATRELVAEIIFRAAQLPMVRYELGYYNPYIGVASAQGDNILNDSLGVKYYGLTERGGIVVANQETNGGKVTSVSVELEKVGSTVYYTGDGSYTGTDQTPAADGDKGAEILNFDVETGLDMFGHAVNVWYNRAGTTHKTYAVIDKAEKSELVISDGANGGNIGTSSNDNLGTIAKDMGFVLNSDKKAFVSNAYGAFAVNGTSHLAEQKDTATVSPSGLYMLISNSTDAAGKPVLDAVISLNVEATKITAVNAHVTAPSINVAYTHGTSENTAIVSSKGTGASDYVVVDGTYVTQAASSTMGVFSIYNRSLTGESETGFQSYVINNAIGGVAASDITNYQLTKLDEPMTAKVVGFYNGGTDKNTDPDYVLLADGSKLYKSPYYGVVANADGTTDKDTVIPQVGGGDATKEVYNNGEWTFFMKDGKYVGATQEVTSDSKLIYATYMDYETVVGSGTLKYYIVGVDLDGEQVKMPVERVSDDGTNFTAITSMSGAITTLGLPYHDNKNAMGSVAPGFYNAILMKGTDAIVGTASTGLTAYDQDADVTFEKTDKLLGVKETKASSGLFFTEKTKFVLVEGLGTDTAKAEIYTGITELLGENTSVKFELENGDKAKTGTTAAGTLKMSDYITDETVIPTMAFYSASDFVYAQSVSASMSKQVDLIVLPKEAVIPTKTSGAGSNLFYVGDNAPTLVNATGEKATQFTMYTAEGEKVSMWVDGLIDTVDSSALKIATTDDGDAFYDLVDTGKTTSGGDKIYKATAHDDDFDTTSGYPTEGTIAQGEAYTAATRDSQTATLEFNHTTKPIRVAGAKVVNLDKDTYPGIVDLETLNDASSVNATIKVSCVMDSENPVAVAVIFVCANQS